MNYSDRARALQARFGAERLADAVAGLAHPRLTENDRAVLARADMFFLATVDGQGRPTCSYKGGDPGFLHAVDDATLAFPSYDGNGMFLSLGNVSATGEVGLLLIDFERQARMRIHGTASVHFDDPLRSKWPEAQLVVRVAIREVFPNCGRYIHKYKLEERSKFVPHAGVRTPVPGWKRSAWAKDALPEHDPAREPEPESPRQESAGTRSVPNRASESAQQEPAGTRSVPNRASESPQQEPAGTRSVPNRASESPRQEPAGTRSVPNRASESK